MSKKDPLYSHYYEANNFPPMRALEFIWDHVTFKLPYDFSYHMKTPQMTTFFIQNDN